MAKSVLNNNITVLLWRIMWYKFYNRIELYFWLIFFLLSGNASVLQDSITFVSELVFVKTQYKADLQQSIFLN